VSGTVPVAVGFGRVAAAEAEGVEVSVAADAELKLLVAIVDGFTPAVAVAPVAAVVGFVAGVLTGRGCDIGVSYRICTCQSPSKSRISWAHTEAMKSPNMAPRPPPMTPAMTVLPIQDSMPICIYMDVS
jgi:hypothetical protein